MKNRRIAIAPIEAKTTHGQVARRRGVAAKSGTATCYATRGNCF